MKVFAIIFVALLILAGATAGAYWYLQIREEPEPAAENPTYSFIELPTMPVALIRNGRAEKLFNVQIVLLFDNPQNKDKVEAVIPAVTDAMITELHHLLPRKILEQRDYDQEIIRMRLEKAVARRIGEGWVYRLSIRNLEQIELR